MMKFGFESEKILYDTKSKKVSSTSLRTLLALEDYKIIYGDADINRVTEEFVHNMIEMSSSPTQSPFEVARDYLHSYELVKEVSARNQRKMLPMGSYPMPFKPTMVSKWQYYVQNAILSGNADIGWDLTPEHGIYYGANCAGVHIHGEIHTLPEYLSLTRELMDKHNLALALVPLSAFAASPYFDGKHEGISMRTLKYYFGVYGKFPEFGGIPPMAENSSELLLHYQTSMNAWKKRGTDLGFATDEINRLAHKHGANWGMVRWNRKWNTVEMRCFDSDLIAMDIAKFTIVSRALKRTDLKKEALQTRVLKMPAKFKSLDTELGSMMKDAFEVSGNEVALLPTPLIHHLIQISTCEGLSDPMANEYIGKIIKFSSFELDRREKWLAQPLMQAYSKSESTSDWILKMMEYKKEITAPDAEKIIEALLDRENTQYTAIVNRMPDELKPPQQHPFPS